MRLLRRNPRPGYLPTIVYTPPPEESGRFLVDMRVATADWQRVSALELPPDAVIDHNPPAAGPEIQITLTVDATSREVAERMARRYLSGLEVGVLASRTRRIH